MSPDVAAFVEFLFLAVLIIVAVIWLVTLLRKGCNQMPKNVYCAYCGRQTVKDGRRLIDGACPCDVPGLSPDPAGDQGALGETQLFLACMRDDLEYIHPEHGVIATAEEFKYLVVDPATGNDRPLKPGELTCDQILEQRRQNEYHDQAQPDG